MATDAFSPLTSTHHSLFHALETYLTYIKDRLACAAAECHKQGPSGWNSWMLATRHVRQLAETLCGVMLWVSGLLPCVSENVFIFFCTAGKLSRRQCPPIACIRFTHALAWSILGHFVNVSEPASSFSNRLGLYSQPSFRSFSEPPSIMVRLSWY